MNYRVILFLISIVLSLSSCGQNISSNISDLLPNAGITDPIHKNNIGKITFTSKVALLKEHTENDFLTSAEIHENSELYMQVFMGNSLVNYLHQLDTTLTADELLKKGNYQFSFYLDNVLIYKENLNHRAGGSPSYKKKTTYLYVPILSTINTDFWSRFLWSRFYHHNKGKAESILENGIHTLRIEVRPYLKNEKIIVGNLIAQGQLKISSPPPIKVSEKEMRIQPIRPNSGWEVSKDNYNKQKIRSLNEKIAQKKFKNITSIVVIKNGKLLIEEYFNDANRKTLHDARSVGKSFAATVTGIAIKEGYLKNTQQTLNEFYDLKQFSNYSTKKGRVTLQSLLTMSSGFDGTDSNMDSPGNEEKMYPTKDWIRFTLDLSMDPAKKIGKNFDYFTAGTVLLGDILHKTVPGGLEKYAHKKLFKPLGITKYKWQYTPQKVASTAGGIQMSALDFAKYGQLYKNNGSWNGKQIITQNWAQRSLTNYFPNTNGARGYGFLFWHKNYKVNDKMYTAFQASGMGGSKIIMFEDEPLVVVVTATAYGAAYQHTQVTKLIQEYVLPAVIAR